MKELLIILLDFNGLYLFEFFSWFLLVWGWWVSLAGIFIVMFIIGLVVCWYCCWLVFKKIVLCFLSLIVIL